MTTWSCWRSDQPGDVLTVQWPTGSVPYPGGIPEWCYNAWLTEPVGRLPR